MYSAELGLPEMLDFIEMMIFRMFFTSLFRAPSRRSPSKSMNWTVPYFSCLMTPPGLAAMDTHRNPALPYLQGKILSVNWAEVHPHTHAPTHTQTWLCWQKEEKMAWGRSEVAGALLSVWWGYDESITDLTLFSPAGRWQTHLVPKWINGHVHKEKKDLKYISVGPIVKHTLWTFPKQIRFLKFNCSVFSSSAN